MNIEQLNLEIESGQHRFIDDSQKQLNALAQMRLIIEQRERELQEQRELELKLLFIEA